MYVIDDYNVPGPTGHSVRIVWRGLPPRIGPGLALTLVGASFLMMAAGIFTTRATMAFDVPLQLGGILLFFIGLFSLVRGREAPDCPTELTWEARDREFRIGRLTALPLMTTPQVIPFDGIRLISFELGAEGRAELQVRCHVLAEGSVPIVVPMSIRYVNRRSKALDLVLRIGAAMGFQGYRITKCTPRALRVMLSRQPETGLRAGAIPSMDDDPTYEASSTEGLPVVPEYEIPPFQPWTCAGPYRVLAWSPGHEVRWERTPPSTASRVVETLVWVLVGFIGAMLMASVYRDYAEDDDPATDACVLGGAFTVVILGLGVRQWMRGPKTIHVDWESREVRVDGFLAHSDTPFRDLRSVVLRGHTSAISASGGPQPWAWNWCEMVLWTNTWGLVIPGPRYQGDADKPVDVMLPMAVELAKALGLPWTWQDYAIPPGTA